MYRLLGGIEVSILDQDKRWVEVITIGEAGPIVSDTHLIILPEVHTSSVQIRLRMSQGLWRINSLNISSIQNPIHLETIHPEQVFYGGVKSEIALDKLLGQKYLVTFPGDEYHLNFPLTYNPINEYFIEIRDIILEWMREEWLIDENFRKAKNVLFNPSRYLKRWLSLQGTGTCNGKGLWDSRYTKIQNE